MFNKYACSYYYIETTRYNMAAKNKNLFCDTKQIYFCSIFQFFEIIC